MEEQLADLLAQTERDHHQAFLQVDGYDPEWPAWYAAHLIPRLEPLGVRISETDLANLLIMLDELYRAVEPEQSWSKYYARRLLDYRV